MRALALALVVAIASLAGCSTGPTSAPPESDLQRPVDADDANEGPLWGFTDTGGVHHSRDTAAGHPALLFFMATWCSSCKSKTQTLARLHDEYDAANISFFSISWDATDDNESLEEWKAQYGQPWPHGVDPGFATQRTFDVVSQSTIVVLEASGRLVHKSGYYGGSYDETRAALEAALARSA